MSRIARLSYLSAAEPPTIVSASIGNPAANCAIPSQTAFVVRVLMTYPRAMTCIQVPVSEIALPII